MSKPFIPTDWYWIVAGSVTQVYSSARGDFVAVSDPTYLGWLADGTVPTQIASATELGSVLTAYLLRPIAATVLDGYQTEYSRVIVGQAIFKILFNQENRLRAIERNLGLNGSPADLTPAQARNAVKALM